jgi:hypothetical protein
MIYCITSGRFMARDRAGIKDRHDKRQEQFEEFRKSTRITNEFLNRRYTI